MIQAVKIERTATRLVLETTDGRTRLLIERDAQGNMTQIDVVDSGQRMAFVTESEERQP